MSTPRMEQRLNLGAVRRELKEAEQLFLRFGRDRHSFSAAELSAVATAYQQLCAKYGYLETFLPGTPETREAFRLVALGRQLLYAKRLSTGGDRRSFLTRVPQAMSELSPYVLLSFLIVAAGGLFAFVLLAINPELSWSLIDENRVRHLSEGHLWTEELPETSGVASSGIATNNITVTLTAFALGITFGVGTVVVLFFNGWLLVGLMAITHRYGMSGRLLEFILAHGFLELSVIFVAGGCGLAIADAMIHPGSLSRKESLRRRAKPAFDLVIFGACCLLPCGYVEGYVSPSPTIPIIVKLLIGLTLGGLYWGYLLGDLRRRAAR